MMLIGEANKGEIPEKTIAVLGAFDGMHLGHQSLFALARDMRRETGLPILVMTLDPHPGILTGNGDKYRKALTPFHEKAFLAQGLGADLFWPIPFTKDLAATSASDFAKDFIAPHAAHIVCGFDYSFGRGGAGRPSDLEAWGRTCGYGVAVAPPFLVGGDAVSSTRVRGALAQGDVGVAAALLGRPYALLGTGGDIFRFPEDKVIPAEGIYDVTLRYLLGGRIEAIRMEAEVDSRSRVRCSVGLGGIVTVGAKIQMLFLRRFLHDGDEGVPQGPSFTLPEAYDTMLRADLPSVSVLRSSGASLGRGLM